MQTDQNRYETIFVILMRMYNSRDKAQRPLLSLGGFLKYEAAGGPCATSTALLGRIPT